MCKYTQTLAGYPDSEIFEYGGANCTSNGIGKIAVSALDRIRNNVYGIERGVLLSLSKSVSEKSPAPAPDALMGFVPHTSKKGA